MRRAQWDAPKECACCPRFRSRTSVRLGGGHATGGIARSLLDERTGCKRRGSEGVGDAPAKREGREGKEGEKSQPATGLAGHAGTRPHEADHVIHIRHEHCSIGNTDHSDLVGHHPASAEGAAPGGAAPAPPRMHPGPACTRAARPARRRAARGGGRGEGKRGGTARRPKAARAERGVSLRQNREKFSSLSTE